MMCTVDCKELCENMLQIFLLAIRVMPFFSGSYFCTVPKGFTYLLKKRKVVTERNITLRCRHVIFSPKPLRKTADQGAILQFPVTKFKNISVF